MNGYQHFEDGQDAFLRDEGIDECPLRYDSVEWHEWRAGWLHESEKPTCGSCEAPLNGQGVVVGRWTFCPACKQLADVQREAEAARVAREVEDPDEAYARAVARTL